MATSTRAAILRAILLLNATLMRIVEAQHAYWVYPPLAGPTGDFKDNILMQVGSKQTLKWVSGFPRAKLELFQLNTPAEFVISDGIEGQEYDWTVNISMFDSSAPHVFWLHVTVSEEDGSGRDVVSCHYFNVTDKEVSSSSSTITSSSTATRFSSSASTASYTTSSMTTTRTTGTANTAPPSESLTPHPGHGIPTGTAVGIAIACTAIVLITTTLLGTWFWCRRKRNKPERPITDVPRRAKTGWGQIELDTIAHTNHEISGEGLRSELQGVVFHEMGGDGRPRGRQER